MELIDFQAIANEMRETVAHWYNAEIQIVDPNTRDLEWNPTTNTYSNNPESVLWSGSARVQPIRTPLDVNMEFMRSGKREIRIQIPYASNLPDFQPGMRVRVTSSPVEHILEGFVYVIRSAINSSYGWNRTIECEVDLKSEA